MKEKWIALLYIFAMVNFLSFLIKLIQDKFSDRYQDTYSVILQT